MLNRFNGLIRWVVAVIEERWSRLLPSMIVEENRGAAEEVHGAGVVVVALFLAVLRWYNRRDKHHKEDGISGRRRGVHGDDKCRWCQCWLM